MYITHSEYDEEELKTTVREVREKLLAIEDGSCNTLVDKLLLLDEVVSALYTEKRLVRLEIEKNIEEQKEE